MASAVASISTGQAALFVLLLAVGATRPEPAKTATFFAHPCTR